MGTTARLISLACLLLGLHGAQAEQIKLSIPIIDDSPQQHEFFHELLATALIEAGHEPVFLVSTLPQLRVKSYLASGRISIYWMIATQERDDNYAPVKVGLTEGLVGKRILFIKPGDQKLYDKVRNLNDFRQLQLVGAMGKDWYSVKVWQENNLPYKIKHGNWKSVFKMIPQGRSFDYVTRGVNEIYVEAKQYPKLSIEKHLVLIMDKDFIFYLSNTGEYPGAIYQQQINAAMLEAKESGLIHRMVEKYWSDAFNMLNYEQRLALDLKMPTTP